MTDLWSENHHDNVYGLYERTLGERLAQAEQRMAHSDGHAWPHIDSTHESELPLPDKAVARI